MAPRNVEDARAASADHLETATWARQALLKSLERAEKGKT